MVWLLAIFLVLFLLFRFVFVPRVGGTISAREDKISGDIGDARRLRDEAEAQAAAAAAEMGEARTRAHKVAADARNAAKADAAARQAEEDRKIAARLADAEGRIGALRAEAMTHVRAIAADTAAAMVEHLTGAGVDKAEIDAALPAEA
jgi:F-type H+-transporting ATPase subunit b